MIIGVTGGVGAGKSTVLGLLKDEFGAHLIMCDDVARKLMEPGEASYSGVVSAFGNDILSGGEGSEIDRKKLSAIVFNDKEKLKLLNSLTHPQVMDEVKNLINNYYINDPYSIIAIEAALLVEAGYRPLLDELWAVTADREVRIERLMESRNYSRERAVKMMENQKSDEEFSSEADFIIYNSKDLEDTRLQIEERIKYLNERD